MVLSACSFCGILNKKPGLVSKRLRLVAIIISKYAITNNLYALTDSEIMKLQATYRKRLNSVAGTIVKVSLPIHGLFSISYT